MRASEVEIWLLWQMLRGGSPLADDKLRALRVGTATAEVIAGEVQERLRAPSEEDTIAHEAGWHALDHITALLGPASLLTASYRGTPRRLYEFDLPMWPRFRFAWAELPGHHGLVVPQAFRRKLSEPAPRALAPWDALYDDVLVARGEPLDADSSPPYDWLRYPGAMYAFTFDLLQEAGA